MPGHRNKYAAAIRLVRKLASEKMGINVSHNEVEAHYARSIDNKLNSLYDTIREMNSEERDKTISLTKAYLLNPNESNKKALKDFKYSKQDSYSKTQALANFLNSISENLLMII